MFVPLFQPPQGAALPPAGVAQALKTPDGFTIRLAYWPADLSVPPRGTILLLQGRAEFIEKYAETITHLISLGFAVVAFDWRGQGGSMRYLHNSRKGHVEEFEDYLLDFDLALEAMRVLAMPEPWNVLAHSMGGAIALHALARGPSPFRRAVLCAPLVRVKGFGGTVFAWVLARLLASVGFFNAFVPGGKSASMSEGRFEDNLLTHDEARFSHTKALLEHEPHLGLGDPTIGWVDAMFTALHAFEDEGFGAKNTTPILMLLAGADKIVDTPAAHRLALRMRNASAIEIHGAAHELMMERDDFQTLFWRAAEVFLGVERDNSNVAGMPNMAGAAQRQ